MTLEAPLLWFRLKGLPKGSNVVLFWVCYGFWVRDYNRLPKKELHRRVWVGWFGGSRELLKKTATIFLKKPQSSY